MLSPIPAILDVITAKLAWMICFYAESVVDIGLGRDGRLSRVISVKSAGKIKDGEALLLVRWPG